MDRRAFITMVAAQAHRRQAQEDVQQAAEYAWEGGEAVAAGRDQQALDRGFRHPRPRAAGTEVSRSRLLAILYEHLGAKQHAPHFGARREHTSIPCATRFPWSQYGKPWGSLSSTRR